MVIRWPYIVHSKTVLVFFSRNGIPVRLNPAVCIKLRDGKAYTVHVTRRVSIYCQPINAMSSQKEDKVTDGYKYYWSKDSEGAVAGFLTRVRGSGRVRDAFSLPFLFKSLSLLWCRMMALNLWVILVHSSSCDITGALHSGSGFGARMTHPTQLTRKLKLKPSLRPRLCVSQFVPILSTAATHHISRASNSRSGKDQGVYLFLGLSRAPER
jgi:hypothetical protein